MITPDLYREAPAGIAVKNDQFVWARCPVRLDLAGGWTDTPPYTQSYGGKVVNLAVNLNGQPPVQVYIRKTREARIRAQSIDLGISEAFTSFAELAGYNQPSSPFALVKAALVLLGFSAEVSCGRDLPALLRSIGGGLDITVFVAVPKGSGLGTSSILSGTLLGALHRFFGHPQSVERLSREVMQIEAMMTTGGGWQDQVGGIVGGVKFIGSEPGDDLKLCTEHLDDYLFSERGRASWFTLYYTGITRLAKDILDQVVCKVRRGEQSYLELHHSLKDLAENMRSVISQRKLEAIADLVALSWDANKRIHESVTNDDVEQLLDVTRPYYRGAKLLGAGGGGYCLFVSETREQASHLRQLLDQMRHHSARIVDFTLNPQGLEVSVS